MSAFALTRQRLLYKTRPHGRDRNRTASARCLWEFEACRVAGWAAGSYTLTFYAAQRGSGNASQQNFNVLVDGVVVGIIAPAGKSYQKYTVTFSVSAGTHTIAFQGLDSAGGDNTVLIDSVVVTH